MNYSNLDDAQVQEIINRLKHPKNQLTFDQIYNTISAMFGKIEVDEGNISGANDDVTTAVASESHG